MDFYTSSGFKKYDAEVKNLEGMLSKVSSILDISSYLDDLELIKKEAQNDNALNNVKFFTFSSMQLDYESSIYDTHTKKIIELSKKAEKELLPFYELHLLTEKIKSELKDISEDNIGEILNNTKLLIDAVNSVNTHNAEEKNKLIDEAYKIIYQILLYEEIFDRGDILSYINYLNIGVNKENIGRLLSKDLKNIDKQTLIDEDLRSIKSEGLGYDYLNENFIKKISRVTVGKENSEYQKRKKKTIESLKKDVTTLSQRKNEEMNSLKSLRKDKFKLYGHKGVLYTKFLSIAMIPIITFSAARAIGRAESNKITEYKTTTRTIDLSTNEMIGEKEVIYDEHETTYVATITEYSPWRINPAGVGYIRNCTAYEYITPKDADDNYHISKDDINGNVREKYSFVESKDVLDKNDSLTESTIWVTETYQDKTDNRPSVKFVVPFSIAGVLIGIAADVALILFKVYDKYELERILNRLNKEIKNNNYDINETKNALIEIKNDAIELQKRYNDAVKKYGSLADQFIFDDVDTSFIKRK